LKTVSEPITHTNGTALGCQNACYATAACTGSLHINELMKTRKVSRHLYVYELASHGQREGMET